MDAGLVRGLDRDRVAATTSLADAQQACFFGPPRARRRDDPRLAWLVVAFVVVPVVWLLGPAPAGGAGDDARRGLTRCADSPEPGSSSTGRWTTPTPCVATSATSRGSTAGWAGPRRPGRALDRLLDGRTVPHSLLDVGTGGADIPLDLLDAARRRGRTLRVTGSDSRAEVLDAARAIDPRVVTAEGLELA